jgi:Na+-transporting methylmalonyl-CoA/oxaloacetate decarboxylase gamma subunit
MLGYVGPGPGLTMVWAFLGLLGTIALAVLSLLIWPIRMMIRKIRGTPPPQDTAAPQEPAAQQSDTTKISQ